MILMSDRLAAVIAAVSHALMSSGKTAVAPRDGSRSVIASRRRTHAGMRRSDERRQPIGGAVVARNCRVANVIQQRDPAAANAKPDEHHQAGPRAIAEPVFPPRFVRLAPRLIIS